MKDLKTKIEVMQAALDGEKIEFQDSNGDWIDSDPAWNWNSTDYRIKPKPREFWVNIYASKDMGYAYETEEKAVQAGGINALKTIKVREVLDENL